MKKFVGLIGSLLLVTGMTVPSLAATEYSVSQKTLSAFSGSTTTLTIQQKTQVKAAVDANPTAEKFICTGIRYFSQPMSVNIMVRKRAKAACEYAKQLNPALSTWFQNKPTKARSFAGKVLLTVKSPLVSQSQLEESQSKSNPSPEASVFEYQGLNSWVQSPEGLMVKVTRLELRPKPGSTQLLLSYEMENRTTSRELIEGSFALFFEDGTKLNQFGFFNKVFPGGSSSRSYVFEWVGSKAPRLVEFEADFFAKAPSSLGLKWLVNSENSGSESTLQPPSTSSGSVQPPPTPIGSVPPQVQFSPLTSEGDVYPTIAPAFPGSQARLIQPDWLNAVVDSSSIQWQTCYHMQVNQRGWDAAGLEPQGGCPESGSGPEWTLPSRDIFVSYSNKMAFLAVSVRYDEIDPITRQKTGRFSFLRTSRSIDLPELRPIENVVMPKIMGEVKPLATISLDTGSWKHAKPITSGTWLICRETSQPYRVMPDTWSVTSDGNPGCRLRSDVLKPLTLGSADFWKSLGYVEVRAAFFVNGEGWSGTNTLVIVSQPITYPPEDAFTFTLNSQRRQMCLPDMECVVANYTITNTSENFATEQTPTVLASSGKSYNPLQFSRVDIPPGKSQTREVVWQIRDELKSSMQMQFGSEFQFQLRDPSSKEFPAITGVSVQVVDGFTQIKWDSVDSYIDGSPLEDEAKEDGSVVTYYTELTGIASQTQRVFNTSPGDWWSTTSGVEVRVWVMGKRTISKPVSFYVFDGQLYFR